MGQMAKPKMGLLNMSQGWLCYLDIIREYKHGTYKEQMKPEKYFRLEMDSNVEQHLFYLRLQMIIKPENR